MNRCIFHRPGSGTAAHFTIKNDGAPKIMGMFSHIINRETVLPNPQYDLYTPHSYTYHRQSHFIHSNYAQCAPTGVHKP